MNKYLVKRLMIGFLVLFFITFLSYMIINFAPGDPATLYVSADATEEQIAPECGSGTDIVGIFRDPGGCSPAFPAGEGPPPGKLSGCGFRCPGSERRCPSAAR